MKIFLLLLMSMYASSSGAQHPSWQNYTTQEGLPSNEIYYMMQDSRGLLWFSTGQGICRFNGYEFTRPIDTSAAATGSTFQIVEDAKGRIWYMNLNATLSIIENDTVRSWEHNHLLKSFVKKHKTTWRFAVGKDGTVWVPSWASGFLVVQRDGTHQTIPESNQNGIVFSEIGGQIINASKTNQDNAAELVLQHRMGQTPEIIRWQNGKAESLGRLPIDYSKGMAGKMWGIWRLRNGDFIAACLNTFYLIRENHLIWYGQKENSPETILQDIDGSILMTVSKGENKGLLRFRSLEHFQRNEFNNLLPGYQVDQVLRDQEGGWWASTDVGVFYCKNPHLDIFDTTDGLPSADVKALTSDGHEKVYAGLRQPDIAMFQHGVGRPSLLPRAPIHEMQTLRFDTLTRRLWGSSYVCFWEKDRWTFAKQDTRKKNDFIPAKKLTGDLDGTHLWASSAFDFYSIDLRTGTGVLISQDSLVNVRTFSVTPDYDGTLWVTTVDGLRIFKNHRYELPPFHHPALRFPARNVELLPSVAGGGMAITLRGGGLLIRDKDGRFTHLTTRDGLTSDVLTDLDITTKGKIYACSNAGLNIISLQINSRWHIETLTTKHGLPSNQVNDVAFLKDEIWVATDKGIARFNGKPVAAPMPPPMLEKFAVNNRDTVFADHIDLAYYQRNISLWFFALHFRSNGDIPYRYRLLPADTAFVYTHNRVANFSLLSPGEYIFEVQAQNEDGQWSEPARWPFRIRPPWWASWWFRSLVAAALCATAYLFFQNRLRAVRREAAEREKIRDLEAAALRAQMNPHFIFNCLQAIQSFIAQNDRDAAATYLARFARLVRLALHGSVDGLHTLAEEMVMLENYLHLEQLRFHDKFEFAVRATPGIDSHAISLPPLLVQPLVENALIHGMQDRERGGRVEVVFVQKGSMLEVSVTDNGPGFSEKDGAKKGPHRSVGMMLTQKRLDLLAGTSKTRTEYFARETIFDENGIVMGALVRILIPVAVE